MDGDQVRGHVVSHLLKALQENVGSIGRESVLATLGDGPSVLLGVLDRAVVGGDGLQLDLDVSPV